MNWDDIRYFLAVADAGSFAAAGRALGVKHTTIARRLTQLEDDLGVTLVKRGPDGIQLTKVGERARLHGAAAADAITAMSRAVEGADTEVAGIVRLAVSEAFSGFIARRLAGLQARHPQVQVHFLVANRAHDVARGEADIALRLTGTENPDLRIRKLIDVGWSLYAAPGYLTANSPVADMASLADHSIIGFDDSMKRTDGAVWLREQGLSDRVVLRTNSIPSAFNAAISGVGIATLPCFLGEEETHLTRVVDEVIATRTLYLVCHPDVARSGRVRAVIDYLTELVDRERATLAGPACATTP